MIQVAYVILAVVVGLPVLTFLLFAGLLALSFFTQFAFNVASRILDPLYFGRNNQ
jgi:hypothetical protein